MERREREDVCDAVGRPMIPALVPLARRRRDRHRGPLVAGRAFLVPIAIALVLFMPAERADRPDHRVPLRPAGTCPAPLATLHRHRHHRATRCS